MLPFSLSDSGLLFPGYHKRLVVRQHFGGVGLGIDVRVVFEDCSVRSDEIGNSLGQRQQGARGAD